MNLHSDLEIPHLNSDSGTYDDILPHLRLLTEWDNSQADPVIRCISGVGSAHSRATYLTCFRENVRRASYHNGWWICPYSFTIFNCSMGLHFWNATHTKPSVTRHILLCISWKPSNYDSYVTFLRQISVDIIGVQAYESPNFLLAI